MPKRSLDPTHTTELRRRFLGEVGRRFRKLIREIRRVVIEEDGFGIRDPDPNVIPLVANRGQFEFTRSAEKVDAFMAWLRRTANAEILEVQLGTPVASAGSARWANRYIETAYQRGIAEAGRKMRGAGVDVDPSWVDGAFNRPVHADRLGLIYTRTFSELEGITQYMEQRMSRVLAQGIGEGRGMRAIAKELSDQVRQIGITRARVLARTEVVAAHAEATLNAYEEAGINGVEVESEFTTSRDSRVCPQCEGLEGRTFTLKESRGLIPVHPNCRCAWSPVVKNGSGIKLNYRSFQRRAA